MKFYNKICVFVILCVLSCLLQPAEAKTYKLIAESMSEFSSLKSAPKYITLQVPAQNVSGANVHLANEAMLRIKVTNINAPKRGKRPAYLEGVIIAYSIPEEGNKAVDVSEKKLMVKVKGYAPTDFKGLAQSAATTVAGQVLGVPFLTQGVAAVKGAVSPAEGESRLKSAGKSAYESSPLAYASKGEELDVKLGDKVTLAIRVNSDERDESVEENVNSVIHNYPANYSYEKIED